MIRPNLPGAGMQALFDPRLTQANAFSTFTHRFAVALTPGNGPTNTDVVRAVPPTLKTIQLGTSPSAQRDAMVSCLMLTRDRFQQAQLAVRCYRRQTWKSRELVIVDLGSDDRLARWVAELGDPSIRVIPQPENRDPLGAVRNLSVEAARGTHICIWDDDDLSHPMRLEAQLATMKVTRTRVSMLLREIFWMPKQGVMAILTRRTHENTLLCEKAAMLPYPALPRGEDTPLVQELISRHPAVYLDLPELYVYVAHGANTWDSEHMAKVWSRADIPFVGPRYRKAISELSRCVPIADYATLFPVEAGPSAPA